MKKVLVEICVGTSCYVMGASELMLIEEHLTPEQRELVDIKGTTCLDVCLEKKDKKAPFVRVDGQVYSEVNVQGLLQIIERCISKK